MKVKKIISMLCVIAIIATACMFNVIAEGTTSNSFTLSLAGLNADEYNSENYTAVNGNAVVSLKVQEAGYLATDSVKLNKNNNVIQLTPVVPGTITVTFDSNKLALNTSPSRTGATKVNTDESPYSFDVTEDDIKAGTSWYIMGDASSVTKVYSIVFTEKSDEPTAEFTAVASKAVVSGDDVTDGSQATGFTATVTNTGNTSGSISKINWTVTSGQDVGEKTVDLGTVTLDGGAKATYGLIILGLYDSSATADVTVE